MTLQIFRIAADADLSDGLFPRDLEGRDWLGYHGTSSAYSAGIEAEGFTRTKPLPMDAVALVEELAIRHPEAKADAFSVGGFRTLGTLSFTADPLLALSYTRPGTLGGQGVGYVLQAAEALLAAKIALAAPDRKRLEDLVSRIREIRTGVPVVYAVDLRGLQRSNYDTGTAGVYVHQWIPPRRILAKALVDPGLDFAALPGSTKRVRELRQKAGSWLSTMSTTSPNRRPWDVVLRKDNGDYTPWRLTAEEGNAERFVELTKEAFAPDQWELIGPEEKRLAEKCFFRELTDGYVQAMSKSGPPVAEQMALDCFTAFFGREPGELRLNAVPDDPELLPILQELGRHEVCRALAQKQREELGQAARVALPSSGASLRI